MTESATTPWTMNTIIHAAFRRDLARFEAALTAFEPGSTDRAAGVKRAWDNFAFQLHHHHNDEETLFWPALREEGVDLSLVSELEGEHELMAQALGEAEHAMDAFAADPDESHTRAARDAMARLRTVLLDHLAHEERDLEPISTAHHDAPSMRRAQKLVRKAHKGNTGTFVTWLQDGIDPEARTALRGEIPAPVLFVIGRTSGGRYRREIASVWA